MACGFLLLILLLIPFLIFIFPVNSPLNSLSFSIFILHSCVLIDIKPPYPHSCLEGDICLGESLSGGDPAGPQAPFWSSGHWHNWRF